MRSLAGCLAHVHAQGLLHGDFKPLNAMRCGTSHRWKLIDFDAATPLGEEVAPPAAPSAIVTLSTALAMTLRLKMITCILASRIGHLV